MEDIWKWYAGRDEERYVVGPLDCREDAIADGTDNFNEEDGFHIIEATKQVFPPPSANRIIEDMFENADDLFCIEDEYPEQCGTKEQQDAAEAELQVMLNDWMGKWREQIFPTPWVFGKTRNAEYIVPKEPPHE